MTKQNAICRRSRKKTGSSTPVSQRPSSFFRPLNQQHYNISQPGDAQERQADTVASSIMRESSAGNNSFFKPAAMPFGQNNQYNISGGQQYSNINSSIAHPATENYLSSISGGKPLDHGDRSFFESKLGHDFSGVSVHSDTEANRSASSLDALAYTNGNNIVFGDGQYRPGTMEGKKLLAHELIHVVQQSQVPGLQAKQIQRYTGCSSAQDTTVSDDHDRAREMLSNAIDTISSYDGSTPTKVHDALDTHFNGSTSNAFATWVNANLRILWSLTWMAGYECFTGGILERGWACRGRDLATTFWCVPGVAIRLCPSYFGESDTERSSTLVHEWVHKYGCNLDLGYEHESDYGDNSTITQLMNADSFANLVRDVQ